MSSTSRYYKTIYQNFEQKKSAKTQNKENILPVETNEFEIPENSEYDELYFENFSQVLKNKREAKQLRKIHEEMFNIYVKKMEHISIDTAKSYSHIIYKFLIFSPAVDPNDLPEFLKQTFNLTDDGGTLKNMLNGTPLNYYNCINQFLKHVYSSELSSYYPEYAKSIEDISKDNNSLPNLKEVINAYVQLQELEKYEDALILNLIYSLGANPETIVLITYDSMDEEGNLTYFDTLQSIFVQTKLSQNLIRDIMFFRDISSKKKKKYRVEYKSYKDKVVIMGDFVFSLSSTAIYNRYTRNFGGKLNWFKYAPEKIIKLSRLVKSIKNKGEQSKCNDLIEDSIKFSEDFGE